MAPGLDVSGIEDEYVWPGDFPRPIDVREPAPERDERLEALLGRIRAESAVSYRVFAACAARSLRAPPAR